jgi:hypothetical protein
MNFLDFLLDIAANVYLRSQVKMTIVPSAIMAKVT